uniref:G-patch domain-containing protein n=1 Tax=Mesocestoides corti TaxID=53468 RepID=A0A5K3F119_MESCO
MTFTNPKRKAAYTLTSVGIPIADNDSNVGQKMLKKMGWIPETGLGKDRNGIVDPIKSLSKHKSHVIPEVKIKLEEKSKSSRSRVHYGRLIRAKDVSQYAQESLKIVLGASQDRSPQSSPDRGKSYSDQEDSIRHEFGVKTYSSNTDLHSYFSMKRKAMKYSPKERSPKIMREHSPISKSVEDVSSLSATSCSNDSPKDMKMSQKTDLLVKVKTEPPEGAIVNDPESNFNDDDKSGSSLHETERSLRGPETSNVHGPTFGSSTAFASSNLHSLAGYPFY